MPLDTFICLKQHQEKIRHEVSAHRLIFYRRQIVRRKGPIKSQGPRTDFHSDFLYKIKIIGLCVPGISVHCLLLMFIAEERTNLYSTYALTYPSLSMCLMCSDYQLGLHLLYISIKNAVAMIFNIFARNPLESPCFKIVLLTDSCVVKISLKISYQ